MMKGMMQDIMDDLTNSTRGYYFMSKGAFHLKHHSLFIFLVGEYHLAMVDNEGG
jgi:hypothetical protein